MNDQGAIDYLYQEKGIGLWNAKMVLLDGMQRTDIISYEDITIRKGMCKVYQMERLTKKEFDEIDEHYPPMLLLPPFIYGISALNNKKDI